MSFSRAFQWYHSHLDPIWPDGTFKEYPHFFQKMQMLDCVRHFIREFETDDSETGDTITVMVQDR